MIQYECNTDLFTSNQLSLVWNKLNAELQCNVLQLKSDMTIANFIEQLENQKNMWKCLFSQLYHQFYSEQSFHWFNIFTNQSYCSYKQHQFNQSSCCLEHSLNNSSNNTFKNTSNSIPYQDYNAQQSNCFWLYNLTDNDQQSCHIEYSLKFQWITHNKVLLSSHSAYFVKSNKTNKSNNNSSDHNDNDSHLINYYVNQNINISSQHNNIYTHKTIVKWIYKCNECSETFSTKNQLNYHIHKNHYNYLASTYHIAVIFIDYVIIMISLKTINKNSQSICLDSEVSHTLVDCSFIDEDQINNISQSVKINKINDNFIIKKYIIFCIYIHDNNTSKIFINIKTYIVDELNIELFIDMNVMQKKDMMLNCKRDILTLANYYDFIVMLNRSVKQDNVIIYMCQF